MQKRIFAIQHAIKCIYNQKYQCSAYTIATAKAGGGLYLHNRSHFQNKRSTSSDQATVELTNPACSCIDDFNLPFAETPEQIVQVPLVQKPGFVVPLTTFIPFSATFFSSLRGPPSAIA